MVRNILPSQNASTHQIWNSYLKECRRYARDKKRDGWTDSAITICLPKFLWGLLVECIIVVIVYIYHSLFKPSYVLVLLRGYLVSTFYSKNVTLPQDAMFGL